MPTNPTDWEVGASVYAWDMHDEGIETILDNLQQMSGVNSVYLIGVMHKERHPWPTTDVFPHNPLRESFHAEDSAVYWEPDPGNYARIKPTRTETDFLKDKDWLAILVDAARRRKLKTGLEITHTVIDRATVRRDLPDCRQLDIHGEAVTRTHVEDIDAVCTNHPDVQQYLLNLYAETIANYDIDYIQNCLMPFPMPARYLLVEHEVGLHPLAWVREVASKSGCFCQVLPRPGGSGWARPGPHQGCPLAHRGGPGKPDRGPGARRALAAREQCHDHGLAGGNPRAIRLDPFQVPLDEAPLRAHR